VTGKKRPQQHQTGTDPTETGAPRNGRESRDDHPRDKRVYSLIAESTEGPTAPIDPGVVTRRMKRAMDRLLREEHVEIRLRPRRSKIA